MQDLEWRMLEVLLGWGALLVALVRTVYAGRAKLVDAEARKIRAQRCDPLNPNF